MQRAPSRTVRTAIDDYVRYLRRQGRSEHTVESYSWALEDLARFAGGDRLLRDLTAAQLEAWQDHVLSRGLAPKSQSLVATAVRSWLRWATEHDLVDWRVGRAVESVRVRRGRPRPIPLEDLDRIRAHLLRSRGSELELRNRALFFVLLTSGFRISEALQLRRERWRQAAVRQKGGGLKALVVPDNVAAMVDQYLHSRTDELPELWVTSEPGRPARPMQAQGVQRIWRSIARQVGVERWTSHQLRHTCGTELARGGLPIQVIAEHLGHEGLATVLTYVGIVEEQNRAKMDLLEGLARTEEPGQTPRRTWVKLRGRPDRRMR